MDEEMYCQWCEHQIPTASAKITAQYGGRILVIGVDQKAHLLGDSRTKTKEQQQ